MLGQSVEALNTDDDSETSDQSEERKISSGIPRYKNLLVSGTPSIVDATSDHSNNSPETSTIAYGDAAYGSRANINACENVGAVSDKINVTPRSRDLALHGVDQ